jgi:hypothetical protein
MAEDDRREKPVFKTIESFEQNYGTRNFIEVALKETNDGENVFFSISKGFIGQNDVKRYKKSLGFAASEELQNFLIDSFNKLLKTFKKLPKKTAEEKPAEAAPAPKAEEKPAEEAKEEPKNNKKKK